MSTKPQITTKEDREEAAHFYFYSLIGIQQDWVESGEREEVMDSDVIALANLISKVRNIAYDEGFIAGAALVKSSEHMNEQRIA